MGKNTNKMIITGPADKLNTIRERFRDFGVDYQYAEEDENEKVLGTAVGGIPQPPVVLNTKERMDAVQPNTRIAPNFIDPAAYPGQQLGAGSEVDKKAPVGIGQEPTGTLVETAGANKNAEFNKKVEEEVQKRLSQDESKKALAEKEKRNAGKGAKEETPDADKSDKSAKGRTTK